MTRRTCRALFTASLVFFTACLDVSFTVAKSVQLPIDGHQSTYSGVALVDLSTNADFQSHKSNVNGISLEKALVSIASINPGNVSTRLTSVSVALRADGAPADGSQDVQLGTITTPLSFQTYLATSAGGGGEKFSLPLTGAQAADKFLMDNVVKGSGKFTAVINAQTDQAETHITLQLDFSNALSYGLL
jgi:hypothetical protein